eukprot:CAMPEP_0204379074 /NCGR_PEP_ID=MMETSP0469-20131031/52318_1 /ASSEMBLY_ACC=CAM_ASM_000384 /TAXON_ID=2969 /ORGANISM="Oxyrrhis marina" /LENGTH=133 /DNA_ID=CAMNT_0051370489 /DNA_START=101 /DNA_END=502 /DNA_ORIENTATION=+
MSSVGGALLELSADAGARADCGWCEAGVLALTAFPVFFCRNPRLACLNCGASSDDLDSATFWASFSTPLGAAPGGLCWLAVRSGVVLAARAFLSLPCVPRRFRSRSAGFGLTKGSTSLVDGMHFPSFLLWLSL